MPNKFCFSSTKVFKSFSLVCLGVLLSCLPAQAADQLDNSTVKRPAEREAPPSHAVATDFVVVKGFRFTGNTAISTAELDTLLSGYIGQSCGLEKIREAALKVTDAYLRHGLTLAKAYIPPQTIEGGIVNIAIIEGRIGAITIEGNKNYSSSFIRRYLTGGHTGQQLSIEQLETGLLLLNSKFTDLKVTANIEPGKEPGTADVHIKVEDSSPLHLTLSSNNYGSKYVSRYRFGAQGEWVNALIPGGKLTASTLIGEKTDNMRVYSGSYEFPVNSAGTSIGITAFDGNFDMGLDFAQLGIHNHETSGELFIAHPLVKRRLSNLSAKLGFRISNTGFYYLDELSAKDKARAIYAQLQGDQVFLGGRGIFGLTVFQGLGTALDGSSSSDQLPPSRQNASNSFTRINLDLGRYQPFTDVFSATLRVSGQWSDNALMAGEEWQIGGVNSVHGYTAGEASGDRGYVTSLALTASPLEKKNQLQISAFLEHGYAYKKYYSVGSKQTHELTGVGMGVTSHLDTFASTDLRLDIGYPLDPSHNYLSQKPVVYFETAFRF